MTFLQNESLKELKKFVVRLSFPKWKNIIGKREYGYSLLVPVPGDLPVFSQLAIYVISKQNMTHLKEILLIPDIPSKKFLRYYLSIEKNLNIKIVEMKFPGRLIGKISKSPNMYHFLQLISGIEAMRSTHVIFHDADMFLKPGNFLLERFELLENRKLSVLGVNPRTRRYTEECKHLVATWEMVATIDWLHRFKPYQLRGQRVNLDGKKLAFDTTHLAQYLSTPDEIKYETVATPFVHFNYLISTYRHYQNSPKPFEDPWFKIFLIRLLIDSTNETDWPYEIPSYNDFLKALNGKSKYIKFPSDQKNVRYDIFRKDLEKLLIIGCFEKNLNDRILELVQPFDKHFGFQNYCNNAEEKSPPYP